MVQEEQKKIHWEEVAIVTITYYPRWYKGKLKSIKHTDKIRGDLSLELFQKSKALGCQTIVVDGKSSKSYMRELSGLGIHLIRRRTIKRSPSRRLAFRIASNLPGIHVIVSVEAEKTSFITNCLSQVVYPIISGQADVVVPKREDGLFQQAYPVFQYQSETEGNRLYNEQLRIAGLLKKHDADLDMFFGPRIFLNNPKVLSLFMRRMHLKLGAYQFPEEYYDPEEFSNGSFLPIALALRKGFRIKSIEIPFVYPHLQKENEEIGQREYFEEKRRWQKLGIIINLMHFLPLTKHS